MASPAIGFEMLATESPPPPGSRADPSGAIGFENLMHNDQPQMENGTATSTDDDPGKDPDQVEVNVEASTPEPKMTTSKSLFLSDGTRRIDYVLAYCEKCVQTDDQEKSPKHESKKVASEAERRQRRQVFEENLKEAGLVLETVDKSESQNGETYFVKIHAPWDVLAQHAELMNMKMPMKENDIIEEESDALKCMPKIPHPFELPEELLKEEEDYFTTYFNRDHLDMFMIKDKDTFFSSTQRTRIVHEILLRTRYEDNKTKIGIKRLVSNQTYLAAYPLHEGEYKSEHSILTHGAENDRHLLYQIWARPRMWYKYQPADLIRDYFGEKIAIYFAWLGFYTAYLIPASIVGLIVFLYGCITMFDYVPSNEICNATAAGGLVMCPLCDKRCNYWKLEKSCTYSRVTYLFDNPATVFFAIFMCLWATMFLEFWKRRQAVIQYDWDVADFEEEGETVRPEYEATVATSRINPVTQLIEPYMPFYYRIPRVLSSLFIVMFMICLVIAAVFCVILYRTIMVALLFSSDDEFIKANAKYATTATAALLNLIIIMLLNRVYVILAIFLTNFEQPKTETEFDDKFTFKMFCFQFVNYYSSIFYVAFFKQSFSDIPGQREFYVLGKYRAEACDPAGCLIELCIQLAIVMIGKQTLNNFKEICIPLLKNIWRARKGRQQEKEASNAYTRWEKDYDLETMPPLGLFDEYLEMVIQYGFITIFVAAFPLAPLFALLNNIIEIRLDAFKFITQYRRPPPARAQDIGIWFSILSGISRLAILTNAIIIAYTADFIPKLVYVYHYSPDGSLDGYMESSLSVFRTNDFDSETKPEDPGVYANVTECRFRGYRNDPGGPDKYKFNMQHWHIVAARVIFILAFEHVIVLFTWLIDFLVPDMPGIVKDQMLREKYLAKEALYSADNLRQRKNRRSPRASPHLTPKHETRM